ncbi:hypothetical protein KHU47_01740 [Bacillus cereus]|uniref:hypothetical protein n=1 Tax=Bacillus cereus TaxID=1396 RepID=UPI001BD9A85C|nr:hypothetical protein [Bacillus cereus]MBT0788171.1 hypothetical protein [Bacillus cereus]
MAESKKKAKTCIVCGCISEYKACDSCYPIWNRASNKVNAGIRGDGHPVNFRTPIEKVHNKTITKEENKIGFAREIYRLWKKDKNCHYTGYPMIKKDRNDKRTFSKWEKYRLFSVDRENGGIYEPGNIVLCCDLINTMKNVLDKGDFDIIVYEILKHRIDKRADMIDMLAQLYNDKKT